jgi:CO/xanthine dehydrogenase FAD-binding subunit
VKLPPFDYVAPTTVDDAIGALARDDAKPLAGGQSLIPLLAFRIGRPALLVDLNGIPELASVRRLPTGGLAVGALTRLRELERSPLVRTGWPLAHRAAPLIGHPQIRNRGTVGGSLAHADPAAELPAVALATGATLVVRGAAGERCIAADAFFDTAFTTALAADEILVEVRVPPPSEGQGDALVEVSRRAGDFAIAGAAATVTLGDGAWVEARLVMLGLGATPLPVPSVADILRGHTASERALGEVAEAVDAVIDPGSDVHGSVAYRRSLARVVARRALLEAARRARPPDDSGRV